MSRINGKTRIKFLVVLVGLTIILIGASNGLAKPGYTAECGTCHTTQTLVISSNATGTVNAEVGTPFTLVIDASGSTSNKDEDFAISVLGGWADNDQFSFTDTEVLDNGVGDLNAAQKEIQASL